MTLMLASVMTAAEARVAADVGADIIDLKNAATGALSALPSAVVAQAVAGMRARRLTSAVAGELANQSSMLGAAVAERSMCGVDIIKVGIHRPGCSESHLALLVASAGRCAMIAVLFAEEGLDLNIVGRLARAGFRGVMLDTLKKLHGGLRTCLAAPDLAAFVSAAHHDGLVCGLAGSLRAGDVASLLALQPDVLGFRGALCVRGRRSLELDPAACRAIRSLIPLDGRGALALLPTPSHGYPAASVA